MESKAKEYIGNWVRLSTSRGRPRRKFSSFLRSKDAVIHVWNVHDPTQDDTPPESEPPLTLAHLAKTESGDLTSLDWNEDGTLLASGSYDCLLRICDASGQLYFSHDQHKVSWNILAM